MEQPSGTYMKLCGFASSRTRIGSGTLRIGWTPRHGGLLQSFVELPPTTEGSRDGVRQSAAFAGPPGRTSFAIESLPRQRAGGANLNSVDERNEASARMLSNVGCTVEGKRRETVFTGGTITRSHLFGLTRADCVARLGPSEADTPRSRS